MSNIIMCSGIHLPKIEMEARGVFCFVFKDFIDLFESEGTQEGGGAEGEEKQSPCNRGLNPRTPGSRPEPKADA